jgi:hypothetical protein
MYNLASKMVSNAKVMVNMANNIQSTTPVNSGVNGSGSVNSSVNVSGSVNSSVNVSGSVNSGVSGSVNSGVSGSVNSGVNGRGLVNSVTDVIVNGANKLLESATVINKAVVSANKSVIAAKNVSVNASVETSVNTVVNAVQNSENLKVKNAVIKAANEVINVSNSLNGKEAASVVANVAVAEAVNVQVQESKNASQTLKSVNKKLNTVKANSPLREKLAKVVQLNEKARKTMIHTAEGNVKQIKNLNGAKVVNVNGTKRVVVPKLESVKLPAHDKSAKPTGQKVYKQGNLKNVYKNKNGTYTVMNGALGNMKNYLFKGANGLFSGGML